MIDLIKEEENIFLVIGLNYINRQPKYKIPVSAEEAAAFADFFNEEFAVAIGKGEQTWSFQSFKITDAPIHPYGWTDRRKRTIFYYNERGWHMIPGEIAEIGKLAKRITGVNG